MKGINIVGQEKTPKTLICGVLQDFLELLWMLFWWSRRESNPRP